MAKRTSRGSKKSPSFYEVALTEAERIRLPQAREIEGLDEEIALLRLSLRRLVVEHPEDMELLLKGVGMLVRAVATKYRLSQKAEDDLYQSVLGVLKGIGGALWPEGFDGV
ncbi:MAG: hypothetical protein HY664_00040 [Chloroflexi bacterium]|nr:hypothetical protein [Chloroflexota bacterium]